MASQPWSRKLSVARTLSRRAVLRAGATGLTGAGAALLFGCGDDDEDSGLRADGELEVTSLRIAEPPPA